MLKEHLAERVGGVVDGAEGEPYAAVHEGVSDVAGVGDGPGEPVEFRDDKGVAGADGLRGPGVGR